MQEDNRHKAMKRKLINTAYGVLIVLMLWGSFTTLVQAFRCPYLSLWGLFLHTPKSMVFDWTKCYKPDKKQMIAKKAIFKVDFMDGVYEGYYFDSPGDTWNGHPNPFLTYDSRERFIRDLGGYKPEKINTEDGVLLLYPIGNQQLKWEKAEGEDK